MAEKLLVYAVFHLNLSYSSIEEEQRPEVLERCYWPLLRLAREHDLPLGIEAPACTLEAAASIDPGWLDELRRLTTDGPCEFVGSGYAQIIGPLVPAEVNAASLRLGNVTYERLLGLRPELAFVNEQAYSAGLIGHYLDAGYRAIVAEWDNPASRHPEWDAEWRYLPQIARGSEGKEIPLIWSKSMAFQKFQRYAHGEMELGEYIDYLGRHVGETARAFPLYSSDVEVFDFRPGRYETEAPLEEECEWERIGRLFEALLADGRFEFIHPSQVLALLGAPGSCNHLRLESPEQPIPVKKQGKYNVSRWAVTGLNDLSVNTKCWRIYEALKRKGASDDDWLELCYLWSSDFRTHVTEKRWVGYLERLGKLEERTDVVGIAKHAVPVPAAAAASAIGDHAHNPLGQSSTLIKQDDGFLTVETETMNVSLSLKRGLAVEGLWLKGLSAEPVLGTLRHGYYDDITLGADFYTGHLIMESPGRTKVTDLSPVDPTSEENEAAIVVLGAVNTPLGDVRKRVRIRKDAPRLEIEYELDWPAVPLGSLRLGHITLNPAAFERETLFYSVHNGGYEAEVFPLEGTRVDHGRPVSFLVSASEAIGITSGVVELGDARQSLRLEVDKTTAALIGMITYREVGPTYFCRLALSAVELDETVRLHAPNGTALAFRIGIGSSVHPSQRSLRQENEGWRRDA